MHHNNNNHQSFLACLSSLLSCLSSLSTISLAQVFNFVVVYDLADYNPPSPPSGSGPHRYYLYVFEQEHQLDNSAKVSASSRCQFSIDSYKKNFGLNAVAMNMFTTVTPENP